jgi:hypothetical protein
VPDIDGMRAGEAPPAVMEEHLPLAVEHHLRGPQAGRAADTRRRTWWGSCLSMIEVNLWGRRMFNFFFKNHVICV